MICLRCGHCCIKYAVIIVDDPSKGIIDGNLIPHVGEAPCKHLDGDRPGEHSCKIHHYPWYDETPCASQGQVESDPLMECRVGRYMIDKFESENGAKKSI